MSFSVQATEENRVVRTPNARSVVNTFNYSADPLRLRKSASTSHLFQLTLLMLLEIAT